MKKISFSLPILLFLFPMAAVFSQPQHLGEEIGSMLPMWSSLPFLGILLSIALFPLLAPRFWHHHFSKVTAFWSLLLAIPFLWFYRGQAFDEILRVILIDYIPFIILLWALFTISGGILVEGDLNGKPIQNTLFLFIGTFLASWIGTTGASMLLIRPVLRANAKRKNKIHIIVFFIFLICNIGGSLTPLGDPPLFLGFLHGVPFIWTFRLIKPLGFLTLLLLTVFFIWDSILYTREKSNHIANQEKHDPTVAKQPFHICGLYNLLFLAGVIGGILMSGLIKLGEVNVLGVPLEIQNLLRDAVLLLMGGLSFKLTPYRIRKNNDFSWAPIKEVAILFAGIFMTIIPTLAMLRAGTEGHLSFIIKAAQTPAHYFWMTGALSSFLDNAPTYLTFLNTALGNFFAGIPEREAVHQLIVQKEIYLLAISCGAVFMGANSYIGNAPNFMVKSIAEENKIKMPSFFGYMAYSIAILIPSFILVTLIFF
jgi:Na+/H+ antiporter NhaD/arsenite permease-like protein